MDSANAESAKKGLTLVSPNPCDTSSPKLGNKKRRITIQTVTGQCQPLMVEITFVIEYNRITGRGCAPVCFCRELYMFRPLIKYMCACAVLGASVLSGCADDSETATFRRYPAFWSDEVEGSRVALAPFYNMSDTFDAEREIRYNVSKSISGTDSYTLLDESGGISNNIQAYIEDKRVVGGVDYVIYGILNHLYVDIRDEDVETGTAIYNDYNELLYDVGDLVPMTYIDGRSSMTIEFYEVASGYCLYSGEITVDSHYENHTMSDSEVNDEVDYEFDYMIDELSRRVADELVPHDVKVTYERGDYIKAAKEFDNGKWQSAKTLSKEDTLHAVLNLPEVAHYNVFTVDVIVKGQLNSNISESIRWNADYRNYNIEFPVKDFYVEGEQEYEVRVLQKGRVIDYRRFSVE